MSSVSQPPKPFAELTYNQVLSQILALDSVEAANDQMHRLTGIRDFFPDAGALDALRLSPLAAPPLEENGKQREWGDFQTPMTLATQICRHLASVGISPHIVVEPTYGVGNFIRAALETFPQVKLVYGVELQEKYEWQIKIALLKEALRERRWSAELELRRDDIFTHAFSDEVTQAADALIIGNPPWVTNAELGALGARNVPKKSNRKDLSGLDALTGKSNFDIGEFIILKLLEVFSRRRATLALLCKNAVIKNIVQALPRFQFPVDAIRAYAIDSRRAFGAAVDDSLLVMNLGADKPAFRCRVASLDQPDRVTRIFGWTRNRFVANVDSYERVAGLDGRSPFMWRQGVKHDCAAILELKESGGAFTNGNGEPVDVETEWVFPLLKGSDLKALDAGRPTKRLIVTQRRIGDDTSQIRVVAPKLWRYLVHNSRLFEKRMSSIYRGKPRFAIFGVGDYAFRPYKVAISGLHKRPRFSLVTPVGGLPVMLDDTSYFLGFDAYRDALMTAALLNSPPILELLESIAFLDAKRPYTKEVLMRIDLGAAARRTSFEALRTLWANANYKPEEPISDADFEAYQCSVREGSVIPQMELEL